MSDSPMKSSVSIDSDEGGEERGSDIGKNCKTPNVHTGGRKTMMMFKPDNFHRKSQNPLFKHTIVRQSSVKNMGKMKNLFKQHVRQTAHMPILTPEKKASLLCQLKQAKEKILQKQSKYLNRIKEAIITNDIESIKDLMLSATNKQFYKRQLQNSAFLSQMLLGKKILMLQVILNDTYYHFDELFIFTFLSGELRKKDTKLNTNDILEVIENAVKMKLYKVSLIKVLAWLICCYDYFALFIELVQKNQKEFSGNEEADFNGFLTQEKAKKYYLNDANFNKTLMICLKENCQEYAIELFRYRNQFSCDKEVIAMAIHTHSRLFLKFVWEKCSGNMPSYISSIVFSIHSIGTHRDFVYDIIKGWNSLNKDAQLMKTLFEIKAYDEISILLFRYPNCPEWKFTQDDCLKIIFSKGIQLILHCLTLKEGIKALEKSRTQKFLIEHYLE